ncbi:MAG: hypothetical protein OEV22_19155, partial [Deltaproteobacteria bacterium]|nr:hypothetical protein [Deltaproteobacteria bacterium]
FCYVTLIKDGELNGYAGPACQGECLREFGFEALLPVLGFGEIDPVKNHQEVAIEAVDKKGEQSG